MAVRGIRGAISVSVDTKPEVLAATRELLEELLRANGLEERFDDIASAIFTTTRDLTSAFPAEAARTLGMSTVRCCARQKFLSPTACRSAFESCCTSTLTRLKPKWSTFICATPSVCGPM